MTDQVAASLARLREELGDETFKHVLGIFVRTSGALMQTMKKSAEAGEGEPLSMASHTLAGSCALIGALGLADRLRELDQLGLAGQIAAARAKLVGVVESVELLVVAVQEEMARG